NRPRGTRYSRQTGSTARCGHSPGHLCLSPAGSAAQGSTGPADRHSSGCRQGRAPPEWPSASNLSAPLCAKSAADFCRRGLERRDDGWRRRFGNPARHRDTGMGRITGRYRDDMVVAVIRDMDARIAEMPHLVEFRKKRLDATRVLGNVRAGVELAHLLILVLGQKDHAYAAGRGRKQADAAEPVRSLDPGRRVEEVTHVLFP